MTPPDLAYEAWRGILELARHSPSPHNVQPWRIRLDSAREAELFIDGRRTLPKEDFTGSFLLSAMGMLLESIDLLAAQQGLRLEYRLHQSAAWFAEKARTEHVAELIGFARLTLIDAPDACVEYPPELFLRRRTCRMSLHSTPIPADAAADLSALAIQWGHRYVQTSTPDQIERILSQNIDAVFHDMNLDSYHDEITSWFRFTDRTARQHRDGLDRRCMNLSLVEFWLSARLPELLLFAPTRALLKRRYRQQLGVVPAIGMLAGDFFVAENAVDSGRFLMRFWLDTARLGLYLHPYGNLVTNPDAARWLETETGVEKVWLVFKIGYASEPPASYRRPLEEILIP